MSGPTIAPSAPLPTPASPAAPATAEAPAGQAAEGGPAAPFAAVLGKQLAQQTAKDTPRQKADVVQLVADAEAGADAPPTDAALAALLPFLLNGAEPTKAEAPPRDAATVIADASAALAIPAILAPAAPMPVAAEATVESLAGNNAANPTAGLGAGTAILAGQDTEAAASLAAEPAQGSFDNLLAAARETAHNLATNQTAPQVAAKSATPELPVPTPVNNAGWDADVGNKLVWMAGRQESRAELVLTPPQMGRIEVSLTVSGDQASATFVSASPAVREALENALPRLREILAEAGVALGQTHVGSESAGQQASDRQNKDNSPHGGLRADEAGSQPGSFASGQPAQWLRGGRTLVDVFA